MLRPIFYIIYIVCLCGALTTCATAASIHGTVRDEAGQPLPFANVFVNNTSTGTTTNENGFYFLHLTPGIHEIVYRYIGYRTIQRTIEIGLSDMQLDIVLEPEHVKLKEVVIGPGNEDPAYDIIRKAIENRKSHLYETDAYSCDVYIKGVQYLQKYPTRFMGVDLHLDNVVDAKTGIFYLSESISEFSWRKPDKIKEVMISSKVSGDNKSFSFNQASDFLFNVYENIQSFNGISQRGIVSPISESALFYYQYRLLGTIEESNRTIYKIEVIPRRVNDPVFRGVIHVIDEGWRVSLTDLYLTKEAMIDFTDSIRIKQVNSQVAPGVWMPITMVLEFKFAAFGFAGKGNFIAIYRNYKVDPTAKPKKFTGEIMRVNKEANKRDTVYWETMRPIKLTEEERLDYSRKDSVVQIQSTPMYLDSMDREQNKFELMPWIIGGYTYEVSKKKMRYAFSPMTDNVAFNTVQGWNAGLRLRIIKEREENRYRRYSPYLNYGFADKTFNASFKYESDINPMRFESWRLEGGSVHTQFNRDHPISNFSNSDATLISERNYMKLYHHDYAAAGYKRELVNGVRAEAGLTFANRTPLINHSDFTLFDYDNRTYTSNNPQFPTLDFPPFQPHRALSLQTIFELTPGQRYITRPERKIVLQGKWPKFIIEYQKGISSDTDFDFASIGLRYNFDLKLFGKSTVGAETGKFFSRSALTFADWHHFYDHRLRFTKNDIMQYRLLNYYEASTKFNYGEVHFEHNFSGFLLNKIPGIKKLKLSEIAAVHYLSNPQLPRYTEFAVGLERLLLRVEFVMSYDQKGYRENGVKFRVNL